MEPGSGNTVILAPLFSRSLEIEGGDLLDRAVFSFATTSLEKIPRLAERPSGEIGVKLILFLRELVLAVLLGDCSGVCALSSDSSGPSEPDCSESLTGINCLLILFTASCFAFLDGLEDGCSTGDFLFLDMVFLTSTSGPFGTNFGSTLSSAVMSSDGGPSESLLQKRFY